MDTSGNVSSEWSRFVSATPNSSIPSTEPSLTTGIHELNLRITNESSRSFLLRWDRHPATNRYAVKLELNGKLEFTRTNYSKNYIRILKRAHREGKRLTLRVRTYSFRDLIQDDKINFEF